MSRIKNDSTLLNFSLSFFSSKKENLQDPSKYYMKLLVHLVALKITIYTTSFSAPIFSAFVVLWAQHSTTSKSIVVSASSAFATLFQFFVLQLPIPEDIFHWILVLVQSHTPVVIKSKHLTCVGTYPTVENWVKTLRMYIYTDWKCCTNIKKIQFPIVLNTANKKLQ